MKLIKESFTLPQVFSPPSDVVKKRTELISVSQKIKTVTNAALQDSAVQAARDIRTWIKEVETARTALTKPLLETQRLIKSLADEHCAPLIEEQKRVERLVTGFQEQEVARVAREEASRQEAFDKAQREKLEAEDGARTAAERARSGGTKFQINIAEKKLEEAEAAGVNLQNIIAAPLAEIQKSSGAATRKILKWEVTDINALAKARPDLCRIEAKASAIQSTCVPEMPVPGLKLWWENKTSIRSY